MKEVSLWTLDGKREAALNLKLGSFREFRLNFCFAEGRLFIFFQHSHIPRIRKGYFFAGQVVCGIFLWLNSFQNADIERDIMMI